MSRQRSADDGFAVGPVSEAKHVRNVGQGLHDVILVAVPELDGSVPGAGGEGSTDGAELETRDGSLVAVQNVQNLSGLKRPEVNLEGV